MAMDSASMDSAYLVVGLGNPGREYEQTRHNAGFIAVEMFGARYGTEWQMEARLHSRMARVEVDGRRVWLCQPQTFMNASGRAVAAVQQFYKVPLGQLLVLVDDADLEMGRIRMRPSGSPGGHHGLESVEKKLGSRDYARVRIGIGRKDPGLREITGHVLGRFGVEESILMGRVWERVAGQLECWLVHGTARAMNEFNGRIEPPLEKE